MPLPSFAHTAPSRSSGLRLRGGGRGHGLDRYRVVGPAPQRFESPAEAIPVSRVARAPFLIMGSCDDSTPEHAVLVGAQRVCVQILAAQQHTASVYAVYR